MHFAFANAAESQRYGTFGVGHDALRNCGMLGFCLLTSLRGGCIFRQTPSHLLARYRFVIPSLHRKQGLPPLRKQVMRTRWITVKERNIANLHHGGVRLRDMARLPHLIAAALQRINRRAYVIIDTVSQPTETSHRMRALPSFMQRCGELNSTSWN